MQMAPPPPPPLDEALPSRRPQRPAAATSAPTPTPNANASRCHFLLVKRVLTVAEFRQERLDRSRINPPHLQPRGIPVPLYPGETQHQYNYKFRQWLTGRGGSLEAIRDDPKRERKMWLTFAFMREKPKEATQRMGAQRVLKRSIDEEYEAFYQRSASQAIKRSRRGRSVDSDRSDSSRGRSPASRVQERREHRRTSPSRGDYFVDGEITTATHSRAIDRRSEILNSYQMPPRASRHRSSSPASQSSRDQPLYPRSRTEILAMRILSAEDYLREMKGPKQSHRANGKLVKIPVPLFPGETMDDYEQDFGRWLHYRQTGLLAVMRQQLTQRASSRSKGSPHCENQLRKTQPL
ncbi:hypothetical protein PHYPSEUDO_005449 [Phytophthora pseudosyringae]|uniref:Uncharacterized protein n=1 Tax=Phytophthora pseudosyringae TaxID=221518 RepID=A0A8T1VKZ5_9STRA|nr:hypothetical protein PHYPSEUDO_005449 [Phytophthora pseudosyringae]